jgi:hypothetical protein
MDFNKNVDIEKYLEQNKGKAIAIACLVSVVIFTSTYVYNSTKATNSTAHNEIVSVSTANNSVTDDKVIPGIAPVDVYLSLEKDGFETTKDFQNCCSWFSVKGGVPVRYLVETYAGDANSVQRVNAVVTVVKGKNVKEIAKPLFGYLATLPYDGADQTAARDWVLKNIGRNAKTKIGVVTFEMDVGSKQGLNLMIYR